MFNLVELVQPPHVKVIPFLFICGKFSYPLFNFLCSFCHKSIWEFIWSMSSYIRANFMNGFKKRISIYIIYHCERRVGIYLNTLTSDSNSLRTSSACFQNNNASFVDNRISWRTSFAATFFFSSPILSSTAHVTPTCLLRQFSVSPDFEEKRNLWETY